MIRAILSGVHRGRLFFDGLDASRERERFRALVGYVSQEDTVHASLSAREVVQFYARFRGVDEDHVEPILRQVDLVGDCWDRFCGELSGGESKRVRVAAELIHEAHRAGRRRPTTTLA